MGNIICFSIIKPFKHWRKCFALTYKVWKWFGAFHNGPEARGNCKVFFRAKLSPLYLELPAILIDLLFSVYFFCPQQQYLVFPSFSLSSLSSSSSASSSFSWFYLLTGLSTSDPTAIHFFLTLSIL